MPSANPNKLEKQASTEAGDPMRQVIVLIEHRIRNLEKRKGKLDSYRTIVREGGELNSDQKNAVAKYDEVQTCLEQAGDLLKQVTTISTDAAKQAKKNARKEAAERMQQDISKVREALIMQECLASLGDKSIRNDFLSGSNGAAKLSEEEIKYLDDIFNEVSIKHHSEAGNMPFTQQAQKVSEHLVALIEGKQREVVGTTYHKIREILHSVTQCGYFDQVATENTNAVEEVTHQVEEVYIVNNVAPEQQNSEEYMNERHIPPSETLLPMPNFPQAQTSHASVTNISGQMNLIDQQSLPNIPPVSQVETSYYTNSSAYVVTPTQNSQPQTQQPQTQNSPQPPRINDVIGGTPNFYFLQDSELDTPESTTSTTSQPQVQNVVPHMSVAVNAPIPTQTFTNQSFVAATVVQPQVIFQNHQSPDIMPTFGTNPPPSMPLSTPHQSTIQFTSQHPGFPQEPAQPQSFESISHHQETQNILSKVEVLHEPVSGEGDMVQITESSDWGQMADNAGGEWGQSDATQQNAQDSQMQNSQQAWGEQQRSGYRGRGGRRGNSNGYNSRGRGGGYQQNGRGGGSYYRNEGSNYQQNGYQRNWSNNDGSTGGSYNSGFKRGTGPRGGPRGDRGGMDRGGRGSYRGPRGTNRGNYAPRGKVQAQN